MKTFRVPVGFPARSAAEADPAARFAPGPAAGAGRAARPLTAWGRSLRRLGLGVLRVAGGGLACTGLAAIDASGQDAPPEPAVVYHAPTDPGELLKIDEPMRRFFRERIPAHNPSGDQLRKLVDTILQPDGLDFKYDAGSTFHVRETFRQRRGNCLSFALLVVAIAREFGFEASFQNVINPIQWDRFGNLVVSIQHINVRVGADGRTYLVDLRPDVIAGSNSKNLQVIDDERAFAQFYDTVGFYQLLQARPAEALQLMVLATKTDPTSAGAWANLAALQAHLGNLADARACFERSLRADPRGETALEGYVALLRRLGSEENLRMAAKYERRAQAVRDRNPYYQQCLAELAQERGDWPAAEKLWRRAIALKDDEPQFYEHWVAVLHQLGRDDAARRAATKLEKLRTRLASSPVHPAS